MKNCKMFIMGIMTALIAVMLITTVFAAYANKSITITYRDIKIIIGGEQIEPKDVTGKTVEPFIYDGTTYLPLRAVSEAVGYDVSWDDKTSTVKLTKKSDNPTTPELEPETKPEIEKETEQETQPETEPDPGPVLAAAFDFDYIIEENGVTIKKYIGKGGEVIIPDKIEGKDVTNIERFAFSYDLNLTGLTIPKSVEYIGTRMIYDCYNLAYINVSEDNTNFCSVGGVLFDKDKTKLIQYPSGDKKTEYTVPSGVKTIGEAAFSYCIYLKTLNLSDSVADIEQWGFVYAESIENLYIGSGLESIEYRAFIGTPHLKKITVSASNTKYYAVDGVLFDKNKNELVKYPGADERESYNIPSGITSICGYAFYSCYNLTDIILPSTLKSIGYASFEYCNGLKNVNIPDSVESIGTWAFTKCSGLESVKIGKGILTISGLAFKDSRGLKDVYFASSTPPTTDSSAFDGVNENARAIIPDGATAYGEAGSLWNGLIVTYISQK